MIHLRIGFALLAFLVALGCSNQSEQNDLAKGQACLDAIPQSNPASATSCLQYVSKYSSTQANILKCSIYMTSGGLVENKIVKAYESQKDPTVNNKVVAFMSLLSLNIPDVDSAYNTAVLANSYCQQSGVSGLIYLSGVIVTGTLMNKTIADVTGTTIDPTTSSSAINTAITNMLADCAGATPDAKCTNNLQALGTTAATLATTYCDSKNSKEQVCTSVNAALAAAGNNATDVGQALFCQLNNKTYNATTGLCN